MGQHRRVDPVRLDLGVGDRLHLQRMASTTSSEISSAVQLRVASATAWELSLSLRKSAKRLAIILNPTRPQRPAAAVLDNKMAKELVVIHADVTIVRHGLTPLRH